MSHLQTAQLLHLVLNKGPQWRHHHSDPRHHQRWELVAEALTPTGWHQYKAVLSQDGSVDSLKLVGPELLEPKHLCEYLEHLLGVWVGAVELGCIVHHARSWLREWFRSGGGGGVRRQR